MKLKKMKLNQNLVLVKVDAPEEKDADGIYVQEEWKTLPPTGTVEAVGEAIHFCKVGDRILFERYSAIDVPFDKDLRICRENSILAVLDEK